MQTQKHTKFTKSKFYIFFLHNPFSCIYKGNGRQKEEIYTDLKKCTQTYFAGLPVFPGLSRSFHLFRVALCRWLARLSIKSRSQQILLSLGWSRSFHPQNFLVSKSLRLDISKNFCSEKVSVSWSLVFGVSQIHYQEPYELSVLFCFLLIKSWIKQKLIIDKVFD